MTLPRLPHAYPFLLLDRIVALDPGRAVVALRNLTRTDPLLRADGVLPPVLLVEALAQAAGVAVSGGGETAPAQAGLVARVDRFRTAGRVQAGDRLRIEVRVVRIFGATAKVRGVVTVGRRRRAAAELVLRLGPPPVASPAP